MALWKRFMKARTMAASPLPERCRLRRERGRLRRECHRICIERGRFHQEAASGSQ